MKETILGNHLRKVPSIAVGCMRLSEKSKDEMNHFIHSALEQGAYFFDHADIYGGGMSETVFGEAFSGDPSLRFHGHVVEVVPGDDVVQLQLFRSRHLDLFRGQCVAEAEE